MVRRMYIILIERSQRLNQKDKAGESKPPLHLIPLSALIHEAQAMKLGAEKYGSANWRTGDPISCHAYISACLRHVLLCYDCSEDEDPESLAHHLGHARATLGILLDAITNDHWVDDRPPPSKAADLMKRFTEDNKMRSEKVVPSPSTLSPNCVYADGVSVQC